VNVHVSITQIPGSFEFVTYGIFADLPNIKALLEGLRCPHDLLSSECEVYKARRKKYTLGDTFPTHGYDAVKVRKARNRC
jgi:hypothetical protein